MAEQWLIDGEQLFDFLSDQLVNENGAFSKGVNKGLNIARSAVRNPDAVKPINPETLPIVRELREELERVTAERDAIKRDIEEAMKISELEFPGFLCEFCAKNPFCVKCNGPEWRGAQKEEWAWNQFTTPMNTKSS